MTLFKPLLAAPLAALALGLAACGGTDDSGRDASAGAKSDAPAERAAAPGHVVIRTFNYQPDPVRIKAGTSVTWKNLDQTIHTVTSGPRKKPDGDFDVSLPAGDDHTQRFDKPGTYRYFCSRHSGPGMEGKVIVE